MKTIRSTRNGKTAKVSARLAKALVSGGKYEYLTREMRPEPAQIPQVQPVVVVAEPAANTDTNEAEETAPVVKPKRQYRRRDVQPQDQE